MRRTRVLALACLAAGGALVAYAVATGQARAGLFLIVPFVAGTGWAALFGTLLVMAGLVLLAFSSIPRAPPDAAPYPPPGAPTEPPRRTRHGGVVLLGPIPIVWGSDRGVLPWMVGAGALLLALAVAVLLLGRP